MNNWTRREILATFLGVPFAFAACRDMNAPKRFPEGEIVGQSATLGHILRENRVFEVPSRNWQTVKVAIVGGGVAGLSAAWKLTKQNFNDFVLARTGKRSWRDVEFRRRPAC